MRGPEMSVSRGATSSVTPEPSRSHESRRRSFCDTSDHAVTATVSAPTSREHLEHMVAVAQDRDTLDGCHRGVGRCRPRAISRPACGSRRIDRMSSATERSSPTTTTRCMHRPVDGAAVQDLASHPVDDEREQHGQRQPDDDDAAGELEVEGVGQRADDGEEGDAGVEEPLVLLAAVADEPVLVGAPDGEGGDPRGREERHDPGVHPCSPDGKAVMAISADTSAASRSARTTRDGVPGQPARVRLRPRPELGVVTRVRWGSGA